MSRPSILRSILAVVVLALIVPTAPAGEPSPPPILGFSAEGAARQHALEARLDAAVEVSNLRPWMERMTAHPHHVGSPHGKANAEFMAELFRSWGWETRIETFHVLFPTPKRRVLEMIAPTRFTASLVEPPIPGDRTSAQQDEQLPTYNAYSADGDVTGELVYVGNGVPADYEELEKRGIDVAGKIVIARYGGSWRGVKPKVAAEHGAIGCIIFSDPAGDGYGVGDVYPKGGWRSDRSVQRGSVMDFTRHNGDPLTPMVGATADAPRVARESSPSLTRIPTLPISYGDALPLLRALGGHVAPEDWRGALPISYRLGPGPTKVHLVVESNWDTKPIYDVVAVLPGARYPDQWILRGNHHDGWVYGATDPVSGMVAELEEARAIGELTKSGWRPQRTLVYLAWDGEEPGLLGSTEWVETHVAELREKAVAYVNSDSNERGFFSAAGSHTLEKMVNQAIRDVVDPEKGIPVLERSRAAAMIFAKKPADAKEARERADLRIAPAGSGSDYASFLQFAGIASLNVSYGDEGEYGQYHSVYDSFDHYVRHMDPTFQYGGAQVKTAGRMVLRLSEAEVLPFDFAGLADNVHKFVDGLKEFTDELREETTERNRRIREGRWSAVADPTKPFAEPSPKEEVPYLNFAPLDNAVARLDKAVAAYDKAYAGLGDGSRTLTDAEREALNRILMLSERALTRDAGLPGRPWFRHQLYAPGVYTGYAPKPMPGISEAIEGRRWQEAEEQIATVGATLEGFAAEVEKATTILKGGSGGRRDAGAPASERQPSASTRRTTSATVKPKWAARSL